MKGNQNNNSMQSTRNGHFTDFRKEKIPMKRGVNFSESKKKNTKS